MDFINEIEKVLEQYSTKPTKVLVEEVFNLMNKWYVNDSRDYEARKIALELATKLPFQHENEVIEAAVKYKKFLLSTK